VDPQTVLLIVKGVELIGSLAPVAIGTALKIKQLLDTEETDFTVEIKVMRDGAIVASDETVSLIEAWKKEKGL